MDFNISGLFKVPLDHPSFSLADAGLFNIGIAQSTRQYAKLHNTIPLSLLRTFIIGKVSYMVVCVLFLGALSNPSAPKSYSVTRQDEWAKKS